MIHTQRAIFTQIGVTLGDFPDSIDLDYSKPHKLVMTLKKEAAGFSNPSNMQDTRACFEAWCLIIKAKTSNPGLKIELDVGGITDASYPGGQPANGHLGRFLYRILKLTKKDIFKSKKWLITVVRCSIFVCFYSLVNMGVSTYLVKSNINEDGLKNNNPLWKFVLGTNPDTCGRYDTNDEIYLGDETKELEVIKDRINNPYKIGKLLLCKTNNFVLNGSLESSSGIYNDKKIKVLGLEVAYKTLEDLVSGVNKVIYGLMILGLVVGVYLKKKDILNSNLFYFYILFITNTLVYMLIEIQPRYTYFINVTVFILGSIGINKLLKLWDNRHRIIKIKN